MQITNQKLRDFIGSGAGVIEEQQQDMVSPSLGRALIGGVQKRIHLPFFKVRNRPDAGLLEGDGAIPQTSQYALGYEGRQTWQVRGWPLDVDCVSRCCNLAFLQIGSKIGRGLHSIIGKRRSDRPACAL